MKKDQVAFLVAGLAFGFLFGFGVYHVRFTAPKLDATAASAPGIAAPQGPLAPTQVGPQAQAAGAPMVAEINALKALLQREPKNLEALVRLANLHHDVGMWAPAASYYERAIEIDPRNPDLITDLGICYRGLERFEQALEMFDRAHGLAPQHWQSLYNSVIVAAFDLGRFDRAESALRALEGIEPPPPNLPELRRRVEEASGRAREAS